MSEQNELASQVKIKLDGTEVEGQVMDQLASAIIEQHSHLPDMFSLRFLDPDLDLLDHGPFNLAKEVEISAQNEAGQEVVLIKGEITALEPEFREGMLAELALRGFDRTHRLYRQTHSRAYVNVKDSDLATQIAQEAGLEAEVESTSILYEHIFQSNQSDLAFLMQRAWRIGYECFVSEGKLFFRKPPTEGRGLTLTWGDELLSFRPRLTLAEQVDEVVVKGWNPDEQAAITGKAENGSLYPRLEETRNGAEWSRSFGPGKRVIVDMPVYNQSEADILAAARYNEISGAFVQAEGAAFRCPQIRAGTFLDLQGLGERFSGSYLVTAAVHQFSPKGLTTRFEVSGSRTGLLADRLAQQAKVDRWSGVFIALVTNTDDPEDVGRVKIKFPWMTDEVESGWARVIGAGASSEMGFYIMPHVGDEVVVAFEHGDFNHPVVIGGLWSAVNKPPAEAGQASGSEKPLVRTWHSQKGHRISVYDNSDNKIEITTSDGRSLTLDDREKKITVKTSSVTITVEDNKVTLDSSGEVTIKAGSNLKLEANGSIDINASGAVNVKGSLINLN
jgi:phage protein D/phage baseplate assembly protein gpV